MLESKSCYGGAIIEMACPWRALLHLNFLALVATFLGWNQHFVDRICKYGGWFSNMLSNVSFNDVYLQAWWASTSSPMLALDYMNYFLKHALSVLCILYVLPIRHLSCILTDAFLFKHISIWEIFILIMAHVVIKWTSYLGIDSSFSVDHLSKWVPETSNMGVCK